MITKAVPARARTRSFAIGVDYITEHAHQRAVARAGHSFEGGVSYASAPEKAEWVHLRGVTSVETAAIEMEAVAALSKRCRDPVYHMIIAYAKNERPTREQVVSDAERLLKAIGMEKSQYVLAAHKDTDDFHARVIANRIGPDSKANDLWHERIKRERVCAEIAAERGWAIVVGHHNRDIVQRVEHLFAPPPDPERRLSDGAYRRLHERGELPWQESARPYVLDAVDRAKDWSDLRQRLRAHGVVAKLVRRGECVQGLAFTEGLDRRAPGCAASRIDARCALRAMQSRFGPFTPAREPVTEIARPAAWADTLGPTVLAAVDSAKTWGDLSQSLDREGIVIKLIQRGARVQGLAFAGGSDPETPGCGAARIHPRCKKAVLERRFGPCPYTPEQPTKRGRGAVSDRAEREARNDPRWALRDAERIADHSRLRSEYRAYRERFVSERAQVMGARRDGAWERERTQRQRDAQRRREARLLLRALARLGTRGVIARHFAYWSVDAVIGRRRAREHDAARVRWEATKIVLASDRRLTREEKPLAYRSFVSERARAGDLGAQRVHDALVAPTRNRSEHVSHREARPVTLAELRLRLNVIRDTRAGRWALSAGSARAPAPAACRASAVLRPSSSHRATANSGTRGRGYPLHGRRARSARATRQRRRSWNPLVRRTATKEEERLHGEQRSRYEKALADATHEFEQRDLPQLGKRLASQERAYRQYVDASLGLERKMNIARAERNRIPKIEQQMNVLDRAGVVHVDCRDAVPNAGLDEFATAIEHQYRALPETLRRDVEYSIRKEQRARDSTTIDR